jgi:hypothetical protein
MLWRYVWLSQASEGVAGQLAVFIGNTVSMLLVEWTEFGWRLTDADGTEETLPLPLLADDGGDEWPGDFDPAA